MGPYLIDMHCHTSEHSFDGRASLAEIVAGLVSAGFHGMVITDHNYVWPAEEIAEYRVKNNLPESFVILSGQEVRTIMDGVVVGDLLVYGPTHPMPDGMEPEECLRQARISGGFCLAAHAGVPRIGMQEAVGDYPITGVEVWNGRYGQRAAAKARAYAEQYGLPSTGGSDTHGVRDIAGGGTLFPRIPRSISDLREMIVADECKPWRPHGGRGLLGWLLGSED